MTTTKPFNICGFITRYEGGESDEQEIIEGFQAMIDSGVVWSLQGCYGRTAVNFIRSGRCIDTHNAITVLPLLLPDGT